MDNKSSSNALVIKSPQYVTGSGRSNLCPQCSVISFNDKILASYIVASAAVKLRTCLDPSATISEHHFDYKATDYKDTDSILDLPVLSRNMLSPKCPLDYKVDDSLPGLPYLEQSALRGCEFCSLLRREIMRARHKITGFVEITLAYSLNPYGLLLHGLAALLANVAQRPGASSIPPASTMPELPSINIVFAVESDDGQFPRRVL